MKLSLVLLVLGACGLAVSVYAFQGRHSGQDADRQTTYYANGQVRSELTYADGRMEGAATRYYADGKKLAEGSYRAGKMDGSWTFWKPDGAIDGARSGVYVDGERKAAAAADDASR